MVILAIFTVVLSYLLGSVSFAVIFTKLFTKKDVRNFGSGNAGSTNALRVGGKLNGILTFICDFLKGTLSSFIGLKVFEMLSNSEGFSFVDPLYGAYLCGIACMIGHIFPLYFGFKGGKGVATGAGIFLSICPVATVIGLVLFAVLTALTKYVSVSSLIATASVVVITLVTDNGDGALWPKIIMALIIGLIIFVRHRENIVRLINGKENKIKVKGK